MLLNYSTVRPPRRGKTFQFFTQTLKIFSKPGTEISIHILLYKGSGNFGYSVQLALTNLGKLAKHDVV